MGFFEISEEELKEMQEDIDKFREEKLEVISIDEARKALRK